MLAYCPLTTLHRKIIYNFVWIYLGQHCISKLLAQCWPRAHRYSFTGKPAFSNVACCLTGYIITKQSWLLLFNLCYAVHLQLAGQQWTAADIDWNIFTSIPKNLQKKIPPNNIAVSSRAILKPVCQTQAPNSHKCWFLVLSFRHCFRCRLMKTKFWAFENAK